MDLAPNDDSLDPNSGMAQALMRSPTYINPAYITPEQMAALRLMADKQQSSPEAKSWTGAIGQTLQALAAQQTLGRTAGLDQLTGASAHKAAMFGGGAPAAANGGAPASAGGVDPQSLVSAYAPQLGAAGAAGLVGGFGVESGYSPTASGDGGHAIGIAQWNDRAPTLRAYAAKYGKPPTDPEVQKRFPLVEMGLAGDQSDPGFGTEAAAGQALRAAKTPQEATAAALMYERPQGYSAAHPQTSNAYGKRLAMATALMGSQGASGAAPTAYAPSTPNAGGMPRVGPGAGTQVPLGAGGGAGAGPMAAGPYQPPAGPVMAQNAPQPGIVPGGPPVQGSKAYADFITNRSIPEAAKLSIYGQQAPVVTQDALGANRLTRPALTPSGTELQPGYAQTPYHVSPAGVSGTTVTRVQQGQPPQAIGGTVDANDLVERNKPAMTNLQGVGQQGAEGLADTERMAGYKLTGTAAEGKLAQLETLKALGASIGKGGLPTQLQGLAARYGVDPNGEGAALQLYTAMAQTLLPEGTPDGLRDRVPGLTADPATRSAFTQFLQNQYQYQKSIGDIARDTKTYPRASDRDAAIGRLKAPQLDFGPPAASGSGGSAAAAPTQAPLSAAEKAESLANARAWIAKNPKDRDRVIKKLQGAGIDPAGL